MYVLEVFFFFQAEDGIRDKLVTGVQTCALPICRTSNTGSAQAYVPLPQSGSYPVTVLAQTPEGQEVRATPPSGSKAESEMCTAKRASASRSFPTRSPTAPAKSRVF